MAGQKKWMRSLSRLLNCFHILGLIDAGVSRRFAEERKEAGDHVELARGDRQRRRQIADDPRVRPRHDAVAPTGRLRSAASLACDRCHGLDAATPIC